MHNPLCAIRIEKIMAYKIDDNKTFFKTIITFPELGVGISKYKGHYEFPISNNVRAIQSDGNNDFALLFDEMWDKYNLSEKLFWFDVPEEVDYFEIDSGPISEIEPFKNDHNSLLIAIGCQSQYLMRNLIVVRTAKHNTMYRSLDVYSQNSIFNYGEHTYDEIYLKQIDLDAIKIIYNRIEPIVKDDSHSALRNALFNFFQCQLSNHLEQLCINTSIILESLFGPDSNSELSHQIAMNVAKHLGDDAKTEENYKLIKSFYSLRSKIVHGATEKNKSKMHDTILKTYKLTTSIIRELLIKKESFDIFKDKKTHSEYLKALKFK